MSSVDDIDGIDMRTLEKAQELLHAPTQADAVNTALTEFVRRRIIENLVEQVAARDPEELESLRRQAWQRTDGDS